MPLAFGADRLTKFAMERAGGVVRLIPRVVRCRLMYNTGMAFSMLSEHPWLLAALTAVVLAAMTGWLLMKPDEPPLARAGFWLIVGGGLGNLYDRLAYGYVIDFIELLFIRFAVFNVADMCVCVGAALAMAGIWVSERGKAGDEHGGV